MRDFPRLGVAIAAALFVLDQLVKYVVTGPLGVSYVGAAKTLVPFFDLRFVPNSGVSLGLFQADGNGMRWILVVGTALIAVLVAFWMARERKAWDQAALGLVLGGALGNIVDRVRQGYVTDYADLHFRGIPMWLCPHQEDGLCRPFLVFNLADAAITIGVVILLVRAVLMREKRADVSENSHA